jgi:hypothetical protein
MNPLKTNIRIAGMSSQISAQPDPNVIQSTGPIRIPRIIPLQGENNNDNDKEPNKRPEAHSDINYNPSTRTLIVTIPFSIHTTAFYITEAFAIWHSTLLSSLETNIKSTIKSPTSLSHDCRDKKTNIVIFVNFPNPRVHSLSNQRTQREVLKQVVRVINGFNRQQIGRLDVVYRAPIIVWEQVSVLTPFWEVKGGYGRWRCYLKEGEKKANVVRSGDDWEARLRNEFRTLIERREL